MKIMSEIVKALALVTQLGLTITIQVAFCIIFGSFLDKKFNTNILFFVIFLIIGVGSAFRTLFVMSMRASKK